MADKIKTLRLPEWLNNKVDEILKTDPETFNGLVKNLLINYIREKNEVSTIVKEADDACSKVIDYLQAKEEMEDGNFTEDDKKTLEIFWKIFDLIRTSPHFIDNELPDDLNE